MSEAKKSAGTEVLAKRNIWVEVDGKVKKVPKGTVLKLSEVEIKAFGKAVTKDVPAKEGDE